MKTGTSMIIERDPRTKTSKWIKQKRNKRRKEMRNHYKRYRRYYKQRNPSKVNITIVRCPNCNKFPGFYPNTQTSNTCKNCYRSFNYCESVLG